MSALSPSGSPPLYDSLRVPDQPYRVLTTGDRVAQGPAPASARVEVTPADPVINVTTAERRPQAYLLVQTASLQPLGGAARILASLTPVPLPAPLPAAVPLGNAYDIDVHDQDGRRLEPGATGQRPVVQLRIPNPSTPGHVVLALHDRGVWTHLSTIHTADVIYAAELPSFGVVVAAYVLEATGSHAGATGGGVSAAWVAVGAALVLVAAVSGLVALGLLRRSPGRAPRR